MLYSDVPSACAFVLNKNLFFKFVHLSFHTPSYAAVIDMWMAETKIVLKFSKLSSFHDTI